MLIGKLKIHLISIFLENDIELRKTKYDKLIYEISRNVVPMIPNRNNNRVKTAKANKYSKNRRKCM
jgi:hypothetical protein